MTIQEELLHTLELIRKEKLADLEQYRQKVLNTPCIEKPRKASVGTPCDLNVTTLAQVKEISLKLNEPTILISHMYLEPGKL